MKDQLILAKVFFGIVIIFVLSILVPALLNAKNDLSVIVGVFIVIVIGFFTITKWNELLEFFKLKESKETKKDEKD